MGHACVSHWIWLHMIWRKHTTEYIYKIWNFILHLNNFYVFFGTNDTIYLILKGLNKKWSEYQMLVRNVVNYHINSTREFFFYLSIKCKIYCCMLRCFSWINILSYRPYNLGEKHWKWSAYLLNWYISNQITFIHCVSNIHKVAKYSYQLSYITGDIWITITRTLFGFITLLVVVLKLNGYLIGQECEWNG